MAETSKWASRTNFRDAHLLVTLQNGNRNCVERAAHKPYKSEKRFFPLP